MVFTNTSRVEARVVAVLLAVSLCLSAFVAPFSVSAQEAPVEEPSVDQAAVANTSNTNTDDANAEGEEVIEEDGSLMQSMLRIFVPQPKIRICHWNNGQGGRYQEMEVNQNGLEGHDDHQNNKDIIPPFGNFPGLNWTPENQAIHANGCEMPEPAVSVNDITKLSCGIQNVTISGLITFEIPTSEDSFVIKLDGNIVSDDETIDDAGPDGVAQNWSHTLNNVGIGTHTVEVIIYDNATTNTGVKASDTTEFTIEVCPPPTVSSCEVTDSVVTTDLANWDLSQTRSAGHNVLIDGGLRIYTDTDVTGSPDPRKAAGYYVVDFPLSGLGDQTIADALDYTAAYGIEPGLQLVVDFDNDGSVDGILVGESVYGNNWWLTNSAAQFVKDNAPNTGGGNGSNWFGTPNEWLVKFPNAQVKSIGYSLGSGVNGDGVINAINLGCVEYTFDLPEVKTCSVTIKSDTTNTVVERAANAVLTWVHGNWIQTLPLAKWIWADYKVLEPRDGEQYTFEKKFGWNPAADVTGVTLKIAADNLYKTTLNSGLVADEITPNNINQFTALDTYSLATSTILDGNNVISSIVKNVPWGTDSSQDNPGGLYYELVITGEGAVDCEVPYVEEEEPVIYTIDGYKWNDADGDGLKEEGDMTLSGWVINLSTMVDEVETFVASTTTNVDGYYSFDVEGEGPWIVREEMQEGWEQTFLLQNSSYMEGYGCDFYFDTVDKKIAVPYSGRCEFGNYYDNTNNDPEYVIDGYKWNDVNDNGEKDGGDTAIAGWTIGLYTIDDEDEDDTILVATTTTNVDGYYSFDVEDEGPWIVREEMQEGWELAYILENGDALEKGNSCYFYFSEHSPELEVSLFSLPALKNLEAESDARCEFGNHQIPQPTFFVDGHKWNDQDADGFWDKDEPTLSGWTITATNGEVSTTTVTDEDGHYSFNLPAGNWTISEVQQSGWEQTGTSGYGADGESCYYSFGDYSYSRVSESEYDATCSFGNHKKNNSNGSSGTRTKKPRGQVLGAATQCGLWLEDYMQKATQNDSYQVLKLQVFLNLQGFTTSLTSVFDDATAENVKKFQSKYYDEVIKPWFEKGIVPHNRPTGFVYKTTRWKINDIMCPGIEAYPSFDGENLTSNVVIGR